MMLSLFKRKTVDIDATFRTGLEFYQSGDIAAARGKFSTVLSEDQTHAGAHHLMGLSHLRENNPKAALAHLRYAFEQDRGDVELAVTLARVHMEFGQLAEALECCNSITAESCPPFLRREHAALLIDFGRHQDAQSILDIALTENQDDAMVFALRGQVSRIQGDMDSALQYLKTAIEKDPSAVHAWLQLATVQSAKGDLWGAKSSLERAKQLLPDNSDIPAQLAEILQLMGNTDAANIELKSALNIIEQQIKQNPRDTELWNSYGLLLLQGGNTKSAIYAFNCALEIDPDHRKALNNLATLFSDIRDLDAAEAVFERAMAIEPVEPALYTNIGVVKFWRGQTKEALAIYDQAAALGVNGAGLAFNRSLAQLLTGQYEAGFANYERRFETKPFRGVKGSRFEVPQWKGEPLTGKHLVVWYEQGLGDTIQCIRYVELLQQRGARVTLYIQPSLVPLLKASVTCDVMSAEEPAPDADYHCATLSLPHLLKTRLDAIPWNGAYIHTLPAWTEKWKAHFAGEVRPKVGVVWAGNPNHLNDSNRSIGFENVTAWLNNKDVAWYSLQKGPTELREARPDICNLAPMFQDFSDTAGAIQHLDLVIAVDTSVAHLAAAMGKATWLMLPFAPDWRWLEARPDSPWYPTMRLFRQSEAGDWTPVVEKVTAALTTL